MKTVDELIKVGRGSQNNIVQNYPEISTYHADIVCLSENTFIIEDKNSTNGTFVNGIRIRRCLCTRNDQIFFSNISFDLNKYFPKEEIKKELQKNIEATLPNANSLKEVPIIKTDPNDFTKEFEVLKEIYSHYQKSKNQFNKKQLAKTTFLRSVPSAIGMYAVPGLLALAHVALPGVGMLFGFLGSVGGIAASNRATNPEKLTALDDEFKIYYSCPKCKSFLGYMPWESLAQKKQCVCKAIWVK